MDYRSYLKKPISKEVTNAWKKTIKLEIAVVFGDPRQNCSGAGICQVLQASQLYYNYCKCKMADGELIIRNKNQAIIRFSKEKLSQKLMQEHLFRTFIRVTEKVQFALKMPRNGQLIRGKIPPGYYLINNNPDNVTVQIRTDLE